VPEADRGRRRDERLARSSEHGGGRGQAGARRAGPRRRGRRHGSKPRRRCAAVERRASTATACWSRQCVEGEDLRLIVIDYKVVAAAMRRPPRVIGDGASTIRELIERQSRRRAAATGGESIIPLDAETERCVAKAGYELDDVLPRARKSW
jgi:hypothetical protein